MAEPTPSYDAERGPKPRGRAFMTLVQSLFFTITYAVVVTKWAHGPHAIPCILIATALYLLFIAPMLYWSVFQYLRYHRLIRPKL